MTAFNIVRFRVKPGREQEFLDAHRKVQADWLGLKKVNMIKSGERSYCIDSEQVSRSLYEIHATLIKNAFQER